MISSKIAKLPKWQLTLIEQIISSLEKNYVFPEKVDRTTLMLNLTKSFSEKFSGLEYATEDGEFNKEEFAKSVNQLLLTIFNDPHLNITYNPKLIEDNLTILKEESIFPWDLPPEDPRSYPETLKTEHGKDLERRGCGFYDRDTKEHLFPWIEEQVKADKDLKIPSNVGYIGLQFIADPKTFSVVTKKAFQVMQSMQDKDAIIIDLRGNSGGSPEGPRHYLSFLFEEKTHLNTIRTRKAGIWKEEHYHTHTGNELHPGEEFKEQTIPNLSKKAIYILTDNKTFSAGEELAYDLQQQKRATIIGEPTTGGAHPYRTQPLIAKGTESKEDINSQFVIDIPNSTSINPISKTNWEDGSVKGVQPDIRVPAKNALQTTLNLIQSKEFKAKPAPASHTKSLTRSTSTPSLQSGATLFTPKRTQSEFDLHKLTKGEAFKLTKK